MNSKAVHFIPRGSAEPDRVVEEKNRLGESRESEHVGSRETTEAVLVAVVKNDYTTKKGLTEANPNWQDKVKKVNRVRAQYSPGELQGAFVGTQGNKDQPDQAEEGQVAGGEGSPRGRRQPGEDSREHHVGKEESKLARPRERKVIHQVAKARGRASSVLLIKSASARSPARSIEGFPPPLE
ncbi:hypothetical protein R1flu_022466 [Riccia fluitans]|uniref:Uncharacterized protein n=1 Tax=Riccia fluitans TaxID=41844 RepID=A0ABD1XPA9_9MARC